MATSTTVKILTQGVQLTTSAATYYPAPANTTTLIKKVTVTNTTVNAVSLTMYKIVSAGTAGASNTILSAVIVPAGVTREVFELENHALAPGDFVQALAGSAASL